MPGFSSKNSSPFTTLFCSVLSAVLVLSCGAFLVSSWGWPLVGDAPLMHYVVFLMRQGMVPYRDIVDLNQPGTYAVEAAVMWFGKGALAWRIFDLLLLCVVGAAMLVLCRSVHSPRSRFPALFATGVFALIHGRDGLIQLGQQDLLMAALLAVAFALLLQVVRSERKDHRRLSLLAGLCLGAACTVKPDALVLPPLLLALVAWELTRRRRPWAWHVSLASAGAVLPVLAALLFLVREQAFGAYVVTMIHLAPYHASLWRQPLGVLFLRSVSSVLLPLFCLWLPIFSLQHRWEIWEDRVLLLGFLFGVFSFCLQGRGYPYHRYPAEVFLLALAARAFSDVLISQADKPARLPVVHSLVKTLAFAGLAFGGLVVVPRSLQEILHFDGKHDGFEQPLRADLIKLGGPALSGQVQCLEMAGGCITTLYGLNLQESSGFLYDCYMYPVDAQAGSHKTELERYRRGFKLAFLSRPPRVVVVSSDECGPPDFAYHKLERWPWLNEYLHNNYDLVREEKPQEVERWGGQPALPYGYRIYVARSFKTLRSTNLVLDRREVRTAPIVT